MRSRARWIVLAAMLGGGALVSAAETEVDRLRGAIDLHCHSSPDTVPRSVDDVQLTRLAREAGMRAIVLKNHHSATAARAQLAFEAVGGIEVFGGVVLNRSVGGLNAEAVRAMAQMQGRRGRIVWLPTFDAENAVRAGAGGRPFVAVVRDGRAVPELAEIFRLVAEHDLVLATGHSTADESLVLIAAAKRAGVKRILVTHVLSPALGATPAHLEKMAALGAMLECVWLTHYRAPAGAAAASRPAPVPIEACIAAIRAVRAEHFVVASDFGQQANPPPPTGLGEFLDALARGGLTADEIDLVARKNPARLLGLAP